jgi:hypothetical protein
MKRLAVLLSLVALSSLTFVAPAAAAAPGNDTYADRIVVGSFPFSDSIDTTEATTDGDDVEANASCGAPVTDASVWYEVTAGTDGYFLVDVSPSDYSAGVIVVTGSPGSFSIETCGAGGTSFYAVSGQTYAILVFDDQYDGAGNGGTLEITIDVLPPPPTVALTVNPTGRFNKVTGSATISGTFRCTGEAFSANVEVQLTQNVGRFTITGYGYVSLDGVTCDGTIQPWAVEVFGSNGKFKGGRTASVAFAYACGGFDCGYDFKEQIVKLR